MDGAVMLAIVSGSFATAGVVGRYAEKLSDNRSFSSKTTLDRDALVNAEVWHYVEELKSEREKLRTLLDEAANKLQSTQMEREQLRVQLQSALARVESLEQEQQNGST